MLGVIGLILAVVGGGLAILVSSILFAGGEQVQAGIQSLNVPDTGSNFSMPTEAIDSAINGTTGAIQTFPVDAAWDFLFGGTFEILKWLGNIVSGMITWIIRLFVPTAPMLPPVFGLVIIGILLMITLYSVWGSLWSFVVGKIIIISIILAIVLLLGIFGGYVGWFG